MTRNRKAILASLVLVPLLASGFALQARSTRGGAQLLDQVLTFVALRYVDTLDAQQLYEKAARGLVNYERYRGFTLTEEGRSVAARIKARHETLTEVFSLMGLSDEVIAAEVEDIEHHLRPQTLKILGKLAAYWKSHPGQLKAFREFAG